MKKYKLKLDSRRSDFKEGTLKDLTFGYNVINLVKMCKIR